MRNDQQSIDKIVFWNEEKSVSETETTDWDYWLRLLTDYWLTTDWDYWLTTDWDFWLTTDWPLIETIDWLLTDYWLTTDWDYWLTIDWLLTDYWPVPGPGCTSARWLSCTPGSSWSDTGRRPPVGTSPHTPAHWSTWRGWRPPTSWPACSGGSRGRAGSWRRPGRPALSAVTNISNILLPYNVYNIMRYILKY